MRLLRQEAVCCALSARAHVSCYFSSPSERSEARELRFPLPHRLTSTCERARPFLTDLKVIGCPSGGRWSVFSCFDGLSKKDSKDCLFPRLDCAFRCRMTGIEYVFDLPALPTAAPRPSSRRSPFRPASSRRRRKHRKRISKEAMRAMIM